MTFAIVCIICALVLYTVAIWSERRKRKLLLWMLIIFAIGFGCDVTGTTIMSMQPSAIGSDLHTYCGFFALAIMLLHLCWALSAYWFHQDRAQQLFTRYSLYAWFIWVAAFLTGVPWHRFS